MKTACMQNPRCNCALVFRLLAVLAICLTCPATSYSAPPAKKGGGGSTPATVVRVEEDWELIVLEPALDSSGPQINCVISPYGNADSIYATLEVNHHSISGDEIGGLQMQVWNGAARVGPAKIVDACTLSGTGESITWTQSMNVSSNSLLFEVTNGSCATWTKFGTDTSSGGGAVFGSGGTTTNYQVMDSATQSDGTADTRTLTTDDPLYSAVSSTLTNLNSYDPQVSVDESGVTYGANLVQSLTLVRVRRYMSDGTVQTDSNPRVVYLNN